MNTTKRSALLALLAFPLALGTVASAAPKISAQSIIVNPVQTELKVKVWTDRDASGANTPNYAPGDRIRLYTTVNQDAYVYLFNVDPNGQVDLILPNKFAGGANYLRANTTKVFPAANDAFTFDIAAPYGLNKVLAVASKTELNLTNIARFNGSSNSFATTRVEGQQQLAQALSIVVNPVPQDSWVSDVAFYNVAQTAYQAPVAQPQPVTPAPSTSYPSYSVTSQTEWRTSFVSDDSVGTVFNGYTSQLRAQGYTLSRTSQRGNTVMGEFSGRSERLSLSVREAGNRIDVVIIRRN